MEPLLSSDDSGDRDIRSLKHQLTEFGLEEDNLSKGEMLDLLRALNYSKETAPKEEQVETSEQNPETIECTTEAAAKVTMKRRYLNVSDRRMPWSLLPKFTAPAEKARTLAVYIKLMSINSYRQARQSTNLAVWPPPIQIMESTRSQPMRSTRSGRSVPVYTGFDDDSSDFDTIITKKKRKVSNSDHCDMNYSNKLVSLKRKPSKDESLRPIKEAKIIELTKNDIKDFVKADFSIIED
ncbi:uncharacterized protein LOC116768714 [Danaus plexippus]|uniref:uncharacterized protein LOC116768714 n=1 Tax=Danaus plexippus TaxID=13037 RepID=UPI002AB1D8D4|nr:uncharacterized protein LOC116768714 [Danaus plexippus]